MTSPAEIEAQKAANYKCLDSQTPAVTGTVVPDHHLDASNGGGHPHSLFLPPMYDYRDCQQLPADQWQSGMCDCMNDTNSCCESVWCHYCMMGNQYHKLKTGMMGPDWPLCLGACCADVWLLSGGAFAFLTWDIRNRVKQRWNIEPEANDVAECCKVFCCPGLAQCQVHRELTSRGYWPGSLCFNGPNVLLPLSQQMK